MRRNLMAHLHYLDVNGDDAVSWPELLVALKVAGMDRDKVRGRVCVRYCQAKIRVGAAIGMGRGRL